jgi:hypothetical protein
MWEIYIMLHLFVCVKGRGMCDIDIDRHGGFQNDDGRYMLYFVLVR